MSKSAPFRTFRDLDPTRFRKEARPAEEVAPRAASPSRSDPEDDAALFRDAVAGTMDISLKNTPVFPDPPARQKGSLSPKAPSSPEPQIPCQHTAPPPAPIQPEETEVFSLAMDGVAPLRGKGRELAPPKKAPPPAMTLTMPDFDDLFPGQLEFSLEYTEEYLKGHVLGLDAAVIEKLKAGAYSPEGHIDLHGQNMEQAYATLVTFVRHAYQSGKRHLLVITGRGKNSPGGMPVLRERVQTWLTRDPFKRVVLAFCTAKPGDGGAGALYLLLRKRRKNQGKIIWDTRPSEEELLR